MGATAGSIPFVGNIGDTDVEMWESNDGTTLWAWYRYNSGLLYYSSGGGRHWVALSTPGSTLPRSLTDLTLDPVGAHGAIAIFPKGVVYSTSNGRNWLRVVEKSVGLSVTTTSKVPVAPSAT
jgi:photosystem II stability/assembly factor-like uncharacterized protein